jgi:hypothetical protein
MNTQSTNFILITLLCLATVIATVHYALYRLSLSQPPSNNSTFIFIYRLAQFIYPNPNSIPADQPQSNSPLPPPPYHETMLHQAYIEMDQFPPSYNEEIEEIQFAQRTDIEVEEDIGDLGSGRIYYYRREHPDEPRQDSNV